MLQSLKIQNLILVRNAEIAFGPGLNILTGETGSGKSAVLSAIRLISGERADAQLVRKGTDLAIIEATLSSLPLSLFTEEGIEPPQAGAPAHLRREIHANGKSRCFVEDQQVNLSFLRKCLGSMIERIDQSSSHSLCSPDEQRRMLDLYGGLSSEAASFAASYGEEQAKESELKALYQSEAQKERELEWAEKDLSLIQEADWQKGEEERLAEEHHLLTHAQELLEKLGSIASSLTEGSLIPHLKRSASSIESCVRFDLKLAPLSQSIKNAALELEEAGVALRSYTDRLETNPQRLDAVEERIALIESIKRRFGATEEEVLKQKEQLLAKIDRLTHLDFQIQELKTSLQDLRKKNLFLAEQLSQKRKISAKKLAESALEEIKSLNLPHAQFEISVSPKNLSSNGCDEVRFLFSANPGVSPIALEDCASGGELSRLLLSIKTVLSEGRSCFIFDEIDSNVGGQTAAILGEKLKKLAQGRQVICVTHFVQVARCASHHFLVSKTEEEGSATTLVSKLTAREQENEFDRMLGKLN